MSRLLQRFSRASGRLDAASDEFFTRRPKFAAALARYGFLLLVAVAALFIAVGAASPVGRGQEIVYATSDGEILTLQPESGESLPVFTPRDGEFAAAPLLNGGSRSLSFTVLRGEGGMLRGDLYSSDLARGTLSLIQSADSGEALIFGGYSNDRAWLMANRFLEDEEPDAVVLTSSGATTQPVEAALPDPASILGPTWTGLNSLYAWRKGDGEGLSLTAYNFFEQRRAVVYETENRVGLPSYNFDSNTIVFDERPKGASLEESRLKAIAGTAEVETIGMEGLGVYDPSIPVPELDDRMAVIWTDGEESGVGLFDPSTWTFEKSNVPVESGARRPQISYDGTYVATSNGDGTTVTVRRMEDGSVVRRIENVQPPGVALDEMENADLAVPLEARWLAPPSYSWRSFEDS